MPDMCNISMRTNARDVCSGKARHRQSVDYNCDTTHACGRAISLMRHFRKMNLVISLRCHSQSEQFVQNWVQAHHRQRNSPTHYVVWSQNPHHHDRKSQKCLSCRSRIVNVTCGPMGRILWGAHVSVCHTQLVYLVIFWQKSAIGEAEAHLSRPSIVLISTIDHLMK